MEPTKGTPETVEEPTNPDTTSQPNIKEQIAEAGGAVEKLKAELIAIDKKKEDAFQKKQDVGTKIADKIKLVNDFKKQRNELTKDVRELKKKRDELNNQINEKVQAIKKLTGGKPLPRINRKDPDNPQALRSQIEKLEFKLETEPMGFEAEQKISKTVKDLQKKLKEKMKVFEGLDSVMAKSKEIDALKREANELHARVTKLAATSQQHHESLIEQSKEIENLKKEEDDFYNTFMEYKKTYSEINAKIRNQLGVAQEAKQVVRKERATSKKKKEAEDKKTLKERANEAEDKIKKKEKLTTEDLLALQGMK